MSFPHALLLIVQHMVICEADITQLQLLQHVSMLGMQFEVEGLGGGNGVAGNCICHIKSISNLRLVEVALQCDLIRSESSAEWHSVSFARTSIC